MKSTKKVFCVSLGCPKNRVDAEVMLGGLKDLGVVMAQNPEDADFILVNTCGFIEAARKESIDTILEMAEFKKDGKKLIVAGCVNALWKDELRKALPEVDLFVRPDEVHKFAKIFTDSFNIKFKSSKKSVDVRHLSAQPFAWLKIAEGCNRKCSFCTIPAIRGKLKSRSIKEIIVEAKWLVDKKKISELILVAQDLTQFGKDTKETLLDLLSELEKIKNLKWIRLMYVYPESVPKGLFEKMASSPKILPYIDMPIQHLSSKILKSMHRPVDTDKIVKRITEFREKMLMAGKIPTIRSTVMVGYPGETEADYKILINNLTKLKIDNVGVFAYSKEEGTEAATLKEQVNPKTSEKRRKEVYKLQTKILEEKNKIYIGKEVDIILDGVHPETEMLFVGRHAGQAPEVDNLVIINDIENENNLSKVKPGFAKALITGVSGLDLEATLLN